MTTLLNLIKTPYSVSASFALFIAFFYTTVAAQSISGIINSYAAVTAFDPCDNKITISNISGSGFQPGNVVLLIQMQGASINENNSPSFGAITNYNSAGVYEKAVIAEVQGNTITFTKDLLRSYDPSGSVQLVSIPQYSNVVVNGELTAAPWNGVTGGILAFEASGSVILNANINVTGRGFRGGGMTLNNSSGCNSFTNITGYFYSRTQWESAFKGEGIAKVISGKELGRGPQANGGGAGNDHNSGGGGGANYGMGGRGGNNDDPRLFTCRGANPGLGGKSVSQIESIFMGGGGGSGHTNNNAGSAGGNGGGIIYIKANEFNGNNRIITANGIAALDGFQDGIGGGGAGGTILLNIADVNTQALSIEAKGGNGGNANNAFNNGTVRENRCFGPGGGGGGGLIAISAAFDPTEINPNISGGSPGITFNSTSGCNNTSNGARAGGNGSIITNVVMPAGILDPRSGCITPTPVDFIYFKAKVQAKAVYLEWATAREVNNNYYSVERSDDGQHFYEIGQVSGKGNYVGVSAYTYQDTNPVYGTSYYRIKQVDYDEKFTHTHVVSVEYNTEEAMMSVFPNPAQEQQSLNVKVYTPVEANATLRIYTVLGHEMYNKQHHLRKGIQTLEINLAGYTAGVYIVHLQVGHQYKTQKVKVLK
jgi:hypothetical protein